MADPRRILLIQLKRAGDILVTTPVLEALRRRLPSTELDILVEQPFAPLLGHNPFLRRVQVFEKRSLLATWRRLRAERYDWILDFQSSPRSVIAGLLSGAPVRAGYRVPFWGRFFTHSIKRPGNDLSVTQGKMTLVDSLLGTGAPTVEGKIYLSEEETSWAVERMRDNRLDRPPVGLIPTHRRDSRRWPAASFVELARRLVAEGLSVWLFWGPGESDYVRGIQEKVEGSRMIPPTSLRQMAALLARCRMVVTNDNGPMHLAVAAGTPTLTIYGPTNPKSWNPGGPRHRVLQATDVACLGCNLNHCPFGHECMTQLTPEHVFHACRDLMKAVS